MKPKFKKEASSMRKLLFVLCRWGKFPESRKLAMWTIFPLSPFLVMGNLRIRFRQINMDVLKRNLISEITSN